MNLKSRKRGATLSFVACITLLIVIMGLGCFFVARILGGAREMQNAVDAGNLNVAKQSLRSPTVHIFASSGQLDLSGQSLKLAQQNFSQLKDPATGDIDLFVYNRLVGQVMLVAMNAASDNYGSGPPNPAGIANAKTLIDLLSDPSNGIGTILANKLKTDPVVDDNFNNLAGLLPMRMLNLCQSQTASVAAAKDISYMVPGTASNLILNSSVIPTDFSAMDPSFVSSSTVSQGGTTYFKGYSLLNIPAVTDASAYPLMGVPLRPMEKPHLVRFQDFLTLDTSPLQSSSAQPADSRVPPNAFKSAGVTAEMKSVTALQLLSCAIVGCVNATGQFQPAIPCGYIVIANGNGVTPSGSAGQVTVDAAAKGLSANGYGGGNGDIFSDVLMYNTVYVTADGAMAEHASAISDIQTWKQKQMAKDLPQTPVPVALADKLDGPMPKQTYADGIDANETPAACDNFSSALGDAKTNMQCVNNLASMAAVYGTNVPSGSSAGTLNGLMALEKEKAGVIDPRPSGGPATVSGLNPGVCTGLKPFNLAGLSPNDPVEFGGTPTVANLLASFKNYTPTAAQGNAIAEQLTLKMMQMRPTSTAADIAKVLDNKIPMGTVRYIWLDSSGTFQFTDAASLPAWINAGNIAPDGSSLVADTGNVPVDGAFVNLYNEQGFPHPWDCPGGPATSRSEETWTRSSGFDCLQGVLRFQNCATDGGDTWRCPC